MIKTPILLQDLRARIYTKAKAEKAWRFWGLYVHVCKMETLREAYRLTKKNRGAPGIDGVTFEDIEEAGLEEYLQEIQEDLQARTYLPMRNRKHEIPKSKGGVRTLGIPAIRDRIVQNAARLILEPIFESDFQPGSCGYRPGKTAQEAVHKIGGAISRGMTRVIDVDLKAYFDTVQHSILLTKIAERVNDDDIMRLLKLILKASGKKGVPQGGPLSPLLSNIYLNEVDKMLEKAKEVSYRNGYENMEYARWADDMVILISGHRDWDWLKQGVMKRLTEELGKLRVTLNREKTRTLDLCRPKESFSFLGFNFSRRKSRQGKWVAIKTPKTEARTRLLRNIKEVFRSYRSQPVRDVIEIINPKLRGWANYFRVGNSAKSFKYVQQWVERKVRRHLMRAQQRRGFGWKRWSRSWIYQQLGLYADWKVRYYRAKVSPSQYVT